MTKTSSAAGAFDSVFHLSSAERAKRVAKSLTDELKTRDVPGFPYAKCLELVARMYGHRTHQDLLADCGKNAPSADDAVAGEDIAMQRRGIHIMVLTEAGIDASTAEAVVDAVAPTRRADPRKAGLFARLSDKTRDKVASAIDYFIAVRRFDEKARLQPRGRAALEDQAAELKNRGDDSLERVDHIVGTIDITEPILDHGPLTLRQMFGVIAMLEERGQTMADFEYFFLLAMAKVISGQEIPLIDDESDEDEPEDRDISPRTQAAVMRHLDKLIKSNFPSPPQSMGDVQVALGFFYIMDAFQFTRQVFWHSESAAKMKEYIDGCLFEIRAVKDAGGTLRDILDDAAGNSNLGTFELGISDDEFVQSEIWNEMSPLKMLASSECDTAFRRAVDVMLSRGRPTEMEVSGAYFHEHNHHRAEYGVTLADGSYVFLYDIAASAKAAGYGMADLAASAARVGLAKLRGHIDFYEQEERTTGRKHREQLDAASCDSWREAFARCASHGRTIPELVAMAAMVDIEPNFDKPPQDYVDAIGRLASLDGFGISLLDVAASALTDDIAHFAEEADDYRKSSDRRTPMVLMMEGEPFGPGHNVFEDPGFLEHLARGEALEEFDPSGLRPS